MVTDLKFSRREMRDSYHRGKRIGFISGCVSGVSVALMVYVAFNAPVWYTVLTAAMTLIGIWYGNRDEARQAPASAEDGEE